MPSIDLVVESPIEKTARVSQLRGLFDIPAEKTSRVRIVGNLPIEEREWNIGLIVGPSGSGKSQTLNHLWPDLVSVPMTWPNDRSVVDAFPDEMGIKDITSLLSSVGFSSPPSWLRPYRVLSNGEKFRVEMARLLAEHRDLAIVDEFTSVVDRQVARVASSAIAKTVRRRGQRLIVASCHHDIEEWLQPDWVFRPDLREFQWRELQRRPNVNVTISAVHYSAWNIFRATHYLNTELNRSARCYMATIEGVPVAFLAVLNHPHAVRPCWRYHRLVCLPDYQGLGIGVVLADVIGSFYALTGRKVRRTASHPAVNAHCSRSKVWKCLRQPSRAPSVGKTSSVPTWRSSTTRLTASFEYCGPVGDKAQALALGILKA